MDMKFVDIRSEMIQYFAFQMFGIVISAAAIYEMQDGVSVDVNTAQLSQKLDIVYYYSTYENCLQQSWTHGPPTRKHSSMLLQFAYVNQLL